MIVNGQKQHSIEIADRALQYGDGCFTTMACKNNQIECFEAHILRLKYACERLFIKFNNWQQVIQHCLQLSQTTADCVIKIIISRGQGGRGYSPKGANHASYIVSQHELPDYSIWQHQGVNLAVSAIQLARQPHLAKIKHLNRLEQVLIKHHLQDFVQDDCVVCDTQGHIIESSMGNLFWFADNQWYTPDCSFAGVEGVMRNRILDFMQVNKIDCQQVAQSLPTLADAQELFMCNSLMHIVPVNSVLFPDNDYLKSYQSKHVIELQKALPEILNLTVKENT